MRDNLIHKIEEAPRDKKLIIFDLDGTLTESKVDMDAEMSGLVRKLLEKKLVAVIGGAEYGRFQSQFLAKLGAEAGLLNNLFLFPTTAAAFYKFVEGRWGQVYKEELNKDEKKQIFSAFQKTFSGLNYKHPDKVYGELIEDRGVQITFSVFGQRAPFELKKKWNVENPGVRSKMEEVLQKYLPGMEVKVSGLTSIDVTRKGIDKAYGIRQVSKYLGVSFEDMLFVGDAFFYEGNDEAVLKTGVLSFQVRGVEDTKQLIAYLLGG